MADNAMLLLTTAKTNRANNMINCHLFIGAIENSLKEKNMIAITPISMAFKINKNSLSLYGSLPELITAIRKINNVPVTKGVKSFAMMGDTFPTK